MSISPIGGICEKSQENDVISKRSGILNPAGKVRRLITHSLIDQFSKSGSVGRSILATAFANSISWALR